MVDDDADSTTVFERALAANRLALIALRTDAEYISPDKTITELRTLNQKA